MTYVLANVCFGSSLATAPSSVEALGHPHIRTGVMYRAGPEALRLVTLPRDKEKNE